jgi:hypothetical protein
VERTDLCHPSRLAATHDIDGGYPQLARNRQWCLCFAVLQSRSSACFAISSPAPFTTRP